MPALISRISRSAGDVSALLDDSRDGAGEPDDAAVTEGTVDGRREHGRAGLFSTVRADQGLEGGTAQEWHVAIQQQDRSGRALEPGFGLSRACPVPSCGSWTTKPTSGRFA